MACRKQIEDIRVDLENHIVLFHGFKGPQLFEYFLLVTLFYSFILVFVHSRNT